LKKKYIFLTVLFLCLLTLAGSFLWRDETSAEVDLNIPFTYVNLPQDLIVDGQPLKEMEIRIKGSKTLLKTYSEQKHSCILDLAHATAGVITLTPDESDLQLPPGISTVQMSPTSVTLRIEPKQVKMIPVAVALSDSPAAGYRVALTMATPSTLQVVGTRKNISRIEQLATRPISIKDASESFKKKIAVELPSGVSIGGGGSPLVTAQINIEEKVVVRLFEDIPVEGRNTVFPVKISPPNINIDVRGPENDLSDLTFRDDIKAYVDLESLPPGVYVRRAQFTLPVGSTYVGTDPEVFTVTIGN
jgi:YbbR domain-containing protein